MAQSTNRFLALADSPSRSRDKPDNQETISMPERVNFPKAVPETFQAIRDVNAIQGYFVTRPLPAHEIAGLTGEFNRTIRQDLFQDTSRTDPH
jgi:hypothetical protein